MEQRNRFKRFGKQNCWLYTFKDGTQFVVSYNTPIVVKLANGDAFCTIEKYSRTTTTHIREHVTRVWKDVKQVPQSEINTIASKYGVEVGRGVYFGWKD